MKKVQTAQKASKQSKSEKAAVLIRTLKSLVGDEDGSAYIKARIDVNLHLHTWLQVVAASNRHGWKIEDVIGDIVDRSIESLDNELEKEEQERKAMRETFKRIDARLLISQRDAGLEAK